MQRRVHHNHSRANGRGGSKEWILLKFFLIFGLSYITGAVLLIIASEQHCKKGHNSTEGGSQLPLHNYYPTVSTNHNQTVPITNHTTILPHNTLQVTHHQHFHNDTLMLLSQQWGVGIIHTQRVPDGTTGKQNNMGPNTTASHTSWRMTAVKIWNNETQVAVDA